MWGCSETVCHCKTSNTYVCHCGLPLRSPLVRHCVLHSGLGAPGAQKSAPGCSWATTNGRPTERPGTSLAGFGQLGSGTAQAAMARLLQGLVFHKGGASTVALLPQRWGFHKDGAFIRAGLPQGHSLRGPGRPSTAQHKPTVANAVAKQCRTQWQTTVANIRVRGFAVANCFCNTRK